MKLNWFSPLPPASTDIAHYTTRVLAALRRHAEVTLWTDQDKWDSRLNEHAEVRRYKLRRMRWAELNRGDMSIYHIGNNPLFHGSIWQVSQRHPGLVVLHDQRLHHFFAGLYRDRWRDTAAYLAQMEFYYGEAGRSDAALWASNQGLKIDEMAERYPLTLLALENALGVLVHTEEAFHQLTGVSQRPMAYAPLPFAAALDRKPGQPPARDKPGGQPYRLIVFGYISNNRRLDALLKALADLPERDGFRLDVYGQISDEREVRALVHGLGLKNLVRLHGFVPETELDAALGAAHLAINLRYPTMGEASGSQLRIWSHALPSLVTEVGWYATLPANTVARVRPAHEIEDIQAHLRAFLSEPTRFLRMGEEGYRLLEEQHAPEIYARSLMNLVARAEQYRNYSASERLAHKAIREVSAWTGGAKARETLQVLARKNSLIYGKTKEERHLPWLRDSALFKRAMRSATLQRFVRALGDY
ncbi:MAG TPA: glycosyltransferase [Pyrinomonadaceae bacterium]|jgi:glycosyltransferase involved in cell wall biosynthesis